MPINISHFSQTQSKSTHKSSATHDKTVKTPQDLYLMIKLHKIYISAAPESRLAIQEEAPPEYSAVKQDVSGILKQGSF